MELTKFQKKTLIITQTISHFTADNQTLTSHKERYIDRIQERQPQSRFKLFTCQEMKERVSGKKQFDSSTKRS